jgi:hypothetical protein
LSECPATVLSRHLDAGIRAVMSVRWSARQGAPMNAYSRAELAKWRKAETGLEAGLDEDTRKRLDALRVQDARLLAPFSVRAADAGIRIVRANADRPSQFVPGNW